VGGSRTSRICILSPLRAGAPLGLECCLSWWCWVARKYTVLSTKKT
jgi:hypothetical protein